MCITNSLHIAHRSNCATIENTYYGRLQFSRLRFNCSNTSREFKFYTISEHTMCRACLSPHVTLNKNGFICLLIFQYNYVEFHYVCGARTETTAQKFKLYTTWATYIIYGHIDFKFPSHILGPEEPKVLASAGPGAGPGPNGSGYKDLLGLSSHPFWVIGSLHMFDTVDCWDTGSSVVEIALC